MSRSPIRTIPHWGLPSARRLERAPVSKRVLRHCQNYHVGLHEVQIQAIPSTPDGQVRAGTIQKLALPTSPGQKPSVTPDELCRLLWLRGERYVRKYKTKTQFRIYLIGVDTQTDFRFEFRFTIKCDEILGDDDGDPDDPSKEEKEEEEEDEDGEDEDEEDEDEDEEEEEEEEEEKDLPTALIPVQQQVVPSGERHPVPMQLNSDFVVALQSGAIRMASGAYSGAMKENRILVQEMRGEMSNMVKDIKGMAETLLKSHIDFAREQNSRYETMLDRAATRAEKADQRIAELSKNSTQQFENLQELAKQGWKAFLDAMKMKSEVVDDRVEWSRWLVDEAKRIKDEEPAPTPTNGKSGASDMLQKAGPIALVTVSAILRNRGDTANADMLQNLANRMAGPLEDDDDDADEEEPYDVEAHEHGAQQPEPSDAAPEAEATPFADRVRAFRASLGEETVTAMRKSLPKPAWRAFESACTAKIDTVAIAGLQTLNRYIAKSEALQIQLSQYLNEDQFVEIMSVIKDIEKFGPNQRPRPPRRPPPRPGPSADPAE